MRALEGLAALGVRLSHPCPTCGAPSRRDAPHLAVLDSTCTATACRLHFTTRVKPKGMETAIARLEALAGELERDPWISACDVARDTERALRRSLGAFRARERARALRLKYL